MLIAVAACWQMEGGHGVEAQVYALEPGSAAKISFKSIYHQGRYIKYVQRTNPKRLCRLKGCKAQSAWRVALVAQTGKLPRRLMCNVRRKKGLALGTNYSQRDYLTLQGAWPLSSNMKPSSKHAAKFAKLYKAAKHWPINKAVEAKRKMTDVEVKQAVARVNMDTLKGLCKRCPWKGIFDSDTPCTNPKCATCVSVRASA